MGLSAMGDGRRLTGISRPVAVVVGAGGQDGRLIAPRLVKRGYRVFCVFSHSAGWWGGGDSFPFSVFSESAVMQMLSDLKPSVIFYLAAISLSSEVRHSYENFLDEKDRHRQIQVVALESFLKSLLRTSPQSKLVFSSSSLVFSPSEEAISETSEIGASEPYSLAKLEACRLLSKYREKSGISLFTVHLFNHESAYRQPSFLTAKLIRSAIDASQGRLERTSIESFSSVTDWGYAPDYCDALVRLSEVGEPSDYVLASGSGHSVREFAELSFQFFGLDYRQFVFENITAGSGLAQKRVGDSSKFRAATGWRPRYSFERLVDALCSDTLELISQSQLVNHRLL